MPDPENLRSPPERIALMRLPDLIIYPNTAKKTIEKVNPPLLVAKLEEIRFCIAVYVHGAIGLPIMGTLSFVQKIEKVGEDIMIEIFPLERVRLREVIREERDGEYFLSAAWDRCPEVSMPQERWEAEMVQRQRRELEFLCQCFLNQISFRAVKLKECFGENPSSRRIEDVVREGRELELLLCSASRETIGSILNRIGEIIGQFYFYAAKLPNEIVANALLHLFFADSHEARLERLIYVLSRFHEYMYEILNPPINACEYLLQLIDSFRIPELVLPLRLPLSQN